jgi:hypothetical protein
MGPRTRTSLAFLFAVAICAYQLMGVGGARFASLWWPLAGVLVVAIALAVNASEMRAAGTPIGFSHGRRLPIAGLSFSFVVTVLVLAGTLGRALLR